MREVKQLKSVKTEDKSYPVTHLMRGLCFAYLLTFIVFVVYAMLLTYTNITEKNIQLVVMLTVVASVLISGFDAARGASKKGWLWGMGSGFVYAFIMILIGICVSPKFSVGTKTFMLLALSIAGGGLGGIIGINIKK